MEPTKIVAEIVTREDKAVDGFITNAIEQKLPVETLERLFALREKAKAEAAREAYIEDMAKLQGELPIIIKQKEAHDDRNNKLLYTFAPIEDIVNQTKDIIARYGFAYAFLTENTPEKVKVTCVITHKYGHKESFSMETGLANRTNIMSGPQQVASTITFNKRYAFCNGFGITTGDEDNDAAGDGEETSVVSIDVALRTLEESKTLQELGAAWAKIPKEYQTKLAARKDELKQKML
jgi:hypothetical protein